MFDHLPLRASELVDGKLVLWSFEKPRLHGLGAYASEALGKGYYYRPLKIKEKGRTGRQFAYVGWYEISPKGEVSTAIDGKWGWVPVEMLVKDMEMDDKIVLENPVWVYK